MSRVLELMAMVAVLIGIFLFVTNADKTVSIIYAGARGFTDSVRTLQGRG